MKPRDATVLKFSTLINDHFKTAIKDGSLGAMSTVPKFTADYLDFALAEREDQIIGMLNEMIADWEGRMGDGDATLYTLGLRRAVDRIVGEENL